MVYEHAEKWKKTNKQTQLCTERRYPGDTVSTYYYRNVLTIMDIVPYTINQIIAPVS
jgi:hypothetical protein